MSRMNQFDNTIDTQVLEHTDLADENARLDEVNPEYTGETINIDGKERTVYNSNGERIAKSEPALRNFWNWFGDSKVVDDNGRPLVVYHGTPSGNFDTFIKDSFFTDDTDQARGYAEIKYNTIAPKGQVFSVYLKMSNPFVFDAKGHFWNALDYKGKNVDGEKLAKTAKKGGYDGVIIQNVKDPAQPWSFVKNTTDFIVFEQPKFAPTAQEKETFLSDLKNKQIIRLGKLPSVYVNLDWESAEVKTNKSVIIKDTQTKHNVPMEVVERLPELYSDPLLVFESATQPDRLVAVIDAKDKSGNQIIVALSPAQKGYHFIPSFYGKDDFDSFVQNNIDNGRLKYIKNSEVWDTLQLRPLKLRYTDKIKQKTDIVNSQIKSTQNRGTFSSDTGNVYHQRTQANGYYDAELKVIVLGRNMNTMTLYHEILDFYLRFCRLLIFFRVRLASLYASVAELKLICASMINNIPKYAGATQESSAVFCDAAW
ncbi:MAG: hypothetical protein IKW57_00220 [Alphaproteobacteria bacterium]|nr:hypothetical protein [Alphaproteobacteria bacterium]